MMTKKKTLDKIKAMGAAIWNVPGVKNAALATLVKLLVRVGIGAGAATLILTVADTAATSL